ncbi:HTH domain-containing protein [Marivirga sp. S37H4]|uniref:HTH-type transcriptional regulator n=1 Tax=Marivirga aurantiaca TaxID=2802615 RepID=A0A934X0L4_9BACT|nr:MarR family transcriptional regulator [Marivirga aurantiaca]MBK6266699.1 HTH domain-containing protein [Marivirga aurantiaca]
MEYIEAKNKFIQAWGTLGSSWGINKAMAQIHALLLISPNPLTTEEIMEELKISRGNANMNIRALIDWGIVEKEHRIGERKEFFSTGKDILELARQVSKERRKREIDPILKVLEQIQDVSGENEKLSKEFKNVTGDLRNFTQKVDGVIEKFSKSDKNWFYKLLMKL